MSSSNDEIAYYILLFILGAYLGHTIGRADRQNALQPQEQVELRKERNK